MLRSKTIQYNEKNQYFTLQSSNSYSCQDIDYFPHLGFPYVSFFF